MATPPFYGHPAILDAIRRIIANFTIPATGSAEAREALLYLDRDFEDAMQVAAAVAGQADYLVTRNTKDFARSPIAVVTPEELVAILES
jgi:predicted nucleic acid-binding protein